jgi:microcystin-dependent protein
MAGPNPPNNNQTLPSCIGDGLGGRGGRSVATDAVAGHTPIKTSPSHSLNRGRCAEECVVSESTMHPHGPHPCPSLT